MKNFRIIALLLAILTLPTVGCGQGSNDTNDTSAEGTNTTTVKENSHADDVPELNFDGAEFRTIEQASIYLPFGLEESDRDVVSDAIWTRQKEAEERFNVVIVPSVLQQYDELSKTITKSVMSGSDEFDLVFGQMYQTASDAQQGIFCDWNEMPYVNFSNPWYVKSINKAAVGDKLYMIESELSITYFQQTWMMLYNKTKAEQMQDFPDLYETVAAGKWTLDELNRLCADTYNDINGNSERDDEDFYGFAGTPGNCLLGAFVYGTDSKIVELNEDFTISTYIDSEQTVDVLTKLSKLFYKNEGTLLCQDATSKVRKELFPKSRVLFEAMQVNDLVNPDFNMRNMADEFGVLPLPKYDKAQEEYRTVVDGGASVMVVPTTAKNLEMIGALTEAMSAYSYSDVIPVYIGVAIEQKGTRDDESIKMLREILDSRVIDFAYLYNGWDGWVTKLSKIIRDENTVVSTIKSQFEAVTAHYESVIDFLTE